MFKTYRGLPRSIYILFIARIINRFGSFVYPILVFFMKGKLGYTDVQTAQIILAMGILSMVGSYFGGILADHLGRKKLYVTAQGIAAALTFACGFIGASVEIITLIIISNFFSSMVRPVSTAMITDLTTKEDRKKAFSLLYLGINLGVAIGPIVAGELYKNYFEWLFFGDGITTFLALILIIMFVPETKPTKEVVEQAYEAHDLEKAEKGFAIVALLKRPVLVLFIVLGFVNNIIYTQHSFAIPLQLESLFGEASGVRYYGRMMSFNAMVVLAFTIILTALTRKIKSVYSIGIASVLYAIGFGMLAYTEIIPLFFVSTLIWTLGEILAVTNQGVFLSKHTPINYRGRFNSIIDIIMGAGYSMGPLIAGAYIQLTSMTLFWITLGAIALVNAYGFLLLGRFETKYERRIIGTDNIQEVQEALS